MNHHHQRSAKTQVPQPEHGSGSRVIRYSGRRACVTGSSTSRVAIGSNNDDQRRTVRPSAVASTPTQRNGPRTLPTGCRECRAVAKPEGRGIRKRSAVLLPPGGGGGRSSLLQLRRCGHGQYRKIHARSGFLLTLGVRGEKSVQDRKRAAGRFSEITTRV